MKPRTQFVGTLSVDGSAVAIHRASKAGHRNALVIVPHDDVKLRIIGTTKRPDGSVHIEWEAQK